MVNRVLLFLALGTMALSGCTLLKPEEVAPSFDPAAFSLELAALPGAEIGQGEALTVSYPGERLFGAESAIPFPGGAGMLDPLARMIIAHPDVRWEGIVRVGSEGAAKYGEALVEKRRELLTRFFTKRGVGEERLPITIGTGEGAPFEVTVHTEGQETPSGISSGEKR